MSSKRDKQAAMERIIRDCVTFGYDLGRDGARRPIIEITWREDGSPSINLVNLVVQR